MVLKSAKPRPLGQSSERPKSFRRDLVLMLAGGAISLVTAASVMYWQTERANADQRHHKQIEALKEFNLQLSKLHDKAGNWIRTAESSLDQVERTYMKRGHTTAEDGQKLIAVGSGVFEYGAENFSQLRAAENALQAYFGTEIIEQATQPINEPIEKILKRHETQRNELMARIAAAKYQKEKNALAPELIAMGRSQFTELKEFLAGEKVRLEVLNNALMHRISEHK